MEQLHLIDLNQLAKTKVEKYQNLSVNLVNDHIIRISIMTEPFYWHYHPNSDESFLCLEGILIIELENQTIELEEGQLFTVPANIPHRTRPKGSRSVNLSFELENMETIKKEYHF